MSIFQAGVEARSPDPGPHSLPWQFPLTDGFAFEKRADTVYYGKGLKWKSAV